MKRVLTTVVVCLCSFAGLSQGTGNRYVVAQRISGCDYFTVQSRDGYAIREAALLARVPCITTLAGARAAVAAIRGEADGEPLSLQERQAAAQAPELWRAAS